MNTKERAFRFKERFNFLKRREEGVAFPVVKKILTESGESETEKQERV
ncbi:hypothetical protein [Leptospira gomenensis]|nr:hypothetical protein [Leptospira gomenensis]